VAAFYWAPPSADALAKAGIRSKAALFKRPPIEIWADLAEAFALFARNQTQWRVGSGGPIGLDYSVLYADLKLRGFRQKQQRRVMDRLRIIERAALEFLHKS